MWKSDNQGLKETPFTQMGRRGGDAEMWRQEEGHHVVQKGSGDRGTGMGSPTFMCGGEKSGGIPWERAIPAPDEIE